MSRYIDREDLLKNLKRFAPEHLTPLIVMLIEKQPTADVVEVVRCRDCKYWDKVKNPKHAGKGICISPNKSIGGYCTRKGATLENDYCSYGERMDGKDGETE